MKYIYSLSNRRCRSGINNEYVVLFVLVVLTTGNKSEIFDTGLGYKEITSSYCTTVCRQQEVINSTFFFACNGSKNVLSRHALLVQQILESNSPFNFGVDRLFKYITTQCILCYKNDNKYCSHNVFSFNNIMNENYYSIDATCSLFSVWNEKMRQCEHKENFGEETMYTVRFRPVQYIQILRRCERIPIVFRLGWRRASHPKFLYGTFACTMPPIIFCQHNPINIVARAYSHYYHPYRNISLTLLQTRYNKDII